MGCIELSDVAMRYRNDLPPVLNLSPDDVSHLLHSLEMPQKCAQTVRKGVGTHALVRAGRGGPLPLRAECEEHDDGVAGACVGGCGAGVQGEERTGGSFGQAK